MSKKIIISISFLSILIVACSSSEAQSSPSPNIGTETASVGDVATPEGMILIPAGTFMMGSDADDSLAECRKYRTYCERSWFEDEEPVHEVYLDDFYIDIYEVTNARYDECVQDGACDSPDAFDSYTRDNYYNDPDYADYPVIHVSWDDAQVYCEWREARLPTEAEWEKAARGTDGRIYPWGDEFDCKKGNFDDETQATDFVVPGGEGCDGFVDTAPVGSFPAGVSPYGLYDMAGNVDEWVNDWYSKYYYANSADENPQGPSSVHYRVLRGGSWSNLPGNLRVANRYFNLAPVSSWYYFYFGLGFRCARSP